MGFLIVLASRVSISDTGFELIHLIPAFSAFVIFTLVNAFFDIHPMNQKDDK